MHAPALSLFELNWLPALYAHPQRWGAWAPYRPEALHDAMRLVQRVSGLLLGAQGLWRRSASALAPAQDFVLWPDAAVHAAAQRLGCVAVAGRVRHAIARAEVLHSLALLGPAGRDQALADTAAWPALAALLPPSQPLPRQVADVVLLGAGVMAGLLESRDSGLQDRFVLRFAPGQLDVQTLAPAQAEEAAALLQSLPKAAS